MTIVRTSNISGSWDYFWISGSKDGSAIFGSWDPEIFGVLTIVINCDDFKVLLNLSAPYAPGVVCAYIHVYTYIYICTCIYVYVHVYGVVCAYTHVYTYMCIYIYVYVHVYMYMYIYVYIHICICTCIYVYVHVYGVVCAYIYVYTCIYMHMYKNTYRTETSQNAALHRPAPRTTLLSRLPSASGRPRRAL